jgi:hypothetical protein
MEYVGPLVRPNHPCEMIGSVAMLACDEDASPRKDGARWPRMAVAVVRAVTRLIVFCGCRDGRGDRVS